MSQSLYFYKQNILPESITEKLSISDANEVIKLLANKLGFEKYPNSTHDESLIEEIDLRSDLHISAYDPIIHYHFSDCCIDYFSENSTSFMMNQEVWDSLEFIIFNKMQGCNRLFEPDESSNLSVSERLNVGLQFLQDYVELMQDYQTLRNLFQKKQLLVAIF
jgi:hypothetical protein